MDEQMQPDTEAALGRIESPLQGLHDRFAGIRPPAPPPPDLQGMLLTNASTFTEIASGVKHWLRDWRTACLPPFIEGSHVHAPEPSWVAASALARGGFSYTGAIDATRAEPVLSYTRWRTQLKLPAAPKNSWLLYRFSVQSAFSADFSGNSAVVSHTLNVGVAPNSATMTPFLTGEYARTQEAGASASGSMDTGVGRLADRGTAMIEGSVRVSEGNIPEIAILLSADIFLHDAWINFVHRGPNHSWVSGVEYAGDGCIEFRYVSAGLLHELAAATGFPERLHTPWGRMPDS